MKELDKSKLYLVACSGGPDSMALLDMLVKENYNLIVAMVNYKTRDESDSEQKLVEDYCLRHNLKCEVSIYDNSLKGNFEDVARKYRYNFFATIYTKYNCDGLVVAHHKDDLIETYLLKKKRNVINESYLIKNHTVINKMDVYRPLLESYYKDDLLKYCVDNNIPYGIDKTNFMDIHSRNVIRKKLATMDKNKVYKEALKEEDKLIKTRKEVKEYIKYYPTYLVSDLKTKDDFFLKLFIYEAIDRKYHRFVNKALLTNFKDFLVSDKPNLTYHIENDYYLEKSYETISFRKRKDQDFRYVLEHHKYISTPYFKIVENGLKMQGVYVSDDDYPIIIRNYNNDDKIALKEGTKKITRLFIDKKVPVLERKMLPVIENKKHEIIFVYGLYRKYGLKYVKNNLFMIK